MPNRIIKESICTSDNLNELDPVEETFFYRILVNCDDYGIADARASILRAKCFPLKVDKVKESDIEKYLSKLVQKQLIFLYEVEGKRYLKMTTWENHQQIRAKRSKHPLPEEGTLISSDINCNQILSDDDTCHRNPIQSESNPNPNMNMNPKKKISQIYINLNFVDEVVDKVKITQEQYDKLASKYGVHLLHEKIKGLDYYLSNGKSYKDHYKTLINWCDKDCVTKKSNETQIKKCSKNAEAGFALYEKYKAMEERGEI